MAGIIGLGLALATFAIWFQRGQTRRCLEFYGSSAARRIQVAPRVELWRLDPTPAPERPEPGRRTDISAARGVVHLRRGLVEDANFVWDRPLPVDPTAPAVALAFYDDVTAADPETVLVVRLDDRGGSVEIAGRPGALALGRIAAGLRTWLADVPSGRP